MTLRRVASLPTARGEEGFPPIRTRLSSRFAGLKKNQGGDGDGQKKGESDFQASSHRPQINPGAGESQGDSFR